MFGTNSISENDAASGHEKLVSSAQRTAALLEETAGAEADLQRMVDTLQEVEDLDQQLIEERWELKPVLNRVRQLESGINEAQMAMDTDIQVLKEFFGELQNVAEQIEQLEGIVSQQLRGLRQAVRQIDESHEIEEVSFEQHQKIFTQAVVGLQDGSLEDVIKNVQKLQTGYTLLRSIQDSMRGGISGDLRQLTN